MSQRLFGWHDHQTMHPWDDAPPWAIELKHMLGHFIGATMSTFDDLKAAQAATDTKIATVKIDLETLIAKLAAIPPAGLTPEQQTALDDAVTHATAINEGLTAVDTEANPPATPPAGTTV